jgi:hypothetical protein
MWGDETVDIHIQLITVEYRKLGKIGLTDTEYVVLLLFAKVKFELTLGSVSRCRFNISPSRWRYTMGQLVRPMAKPGISGVIWCYENDVSRVNVAWWQNKTTTQLCFDSPVKFMIWNVYVQYKAAHKGWVPRVHIKTLLRAVSRFSHPIGRWID